MGLLVIISSPSGGGKDAVINALTKQIPNSGRFITTTTRAPRPGNKNGVDYFFITPEEFERKIKNNEFIEHNFYAGNYYGTEKARLAECLDKFTVTFSQIEVNGKHNFDKAGIPNLSIFLMPENEMVLKKRIEKRGGINKEYILERLRIAKKEIIDSKDYDFRIVNAEGKLTETITKLKEIITHRLSHPIALD